MYKTTMFILLFAVTQVQGLSLSRVFQDPKVFDPNAYDMGNSQPVLINDRILFAGRSEEGSALWALDINTLEKSVILPGYGTNGRIEYIRLGHEVFFKFNTDHISGSQIWRSDGTAAGTSLLFAGEMSNFTPLTKSNDLFYGETRDGELVVSDGQEVVVHHAEPVYTEKVCAMNPGMVFLYDDSGAQPKYRWSTADDSQEFDIPVSNDYSRYDSEMIAHDGACFVIGYNAESTFGGDVLKVSDELVITNISEQAGMGSEVRQIIFHQNKLYAIIFGITADNSIVRLNADLSQIDATSEIPIIPIIFSRGPYLALMYFPATSPPSIGINFLDSELSNVGGLGGSKFTSTNPQVPPDFYLFGNHWLMAMPVFLGDNELTKSLVFDAFTDQEKRLNLPQANSHKVISSDDNDRVFMLSLDQEYKGVLYEIEETPSIGKVVDGSWIAPNINNQGLMLRTGQRHDGSDYLIATAYTFQDGEPFWFAGVADVQPLQKSIQMAVYSYSGIGFFESNVSPDQIPIGQLRLELSSCQALEMSLSIPPDTLDLTLNRVDDVSATAYCVD